MSRRYLLSFRDVEVVLVSSIRVVFGRVDHWLLLGVR